MQKNVLPIDPTKKVRLIIYYNKFKTSNLIISNNSSSATELLNWTNVVYMFKCPLGDCLFKENNTCVGLTTTTLSRRLTMHLNDSSSIALHLKTHFIPKSKSSKNSSWKHHNNKVKLSPFSQGWPEGSLFDSYYTKVLGRALLLSQDCSTLPLIRTL